MGEIIQKACEENPTVWWRLCDREEKLKIFKKFLIFFKSTR